MVFHVQKGQGVSVSIQERQEQWPYKSLQIQIYKQDNKSISELVWFQQQPRALSRGTKKLEAISESKRIQYLAILSAIHEMIVYSSPDKEILGKSYLLMTWEVLLENTKYVCY